LSPILGIIASQNYSRVPATSYESIATVSGTGSSNTISFTSIPSTYKHLQVRFISRSTSSSYNQINLQFNSDTAANYSVHLINGDGSTVVAYGGANATSISVGMGTGSSNSANLYGASVIDVLDYANTNKFKTTRALAGADGNGSGYLWYASGNWRSTSAVTSIQLIAESGSFTTDSKFALYGIRG
jgi:hypothetical protein